MLRRIKVLISNIICIPKRILFTHISPFAALQESTIDKKAAICSGVRFYRSTIGKYSYVGNNSFVTDSEIGSFTSIGSGCSIGGAAHSISWVSTSPVFNNNDNILNTNFTHKEFEILKKTTIGNDVWIAENVMIKSGVHIGNGAIVGMGSIVTKDINPYEIWAGNPAKFIRKRFSDQIIADLMMIKWWDFDDEEIKKHANLIDSPEEFVSSIIDNDNEI